MASPISVSERRQHPPIVIRIRTTQHRPDFALKQGLAGFVSRTSCRKVFSLTTGNTEFRTVSSAGANAVAGSLNSSAVFPCTLCRASVSSCFSVFLSVGQGLLGVMVAGAFPRWGGGCVFGSGVGSGLCAWVGGFSGRACWSSFLGVVQIFIGGAPYGLVCSSGLVLLGSWGFRVFRWPGVRALFGWVFDLVFCFLVGLVVRSGCCCSVWLFRAGLVWCCFVDG